MLKMFLNLYGFELYGDNPHSNNPIALYFREIFKSRVIPAIRKDKKFREHNIPSDWQFDRQNNIYRMSYGETKVIIDKFSKRRGKSTIRKIEAKKKGKKKK